MGAKQSSDTSEGALEVVFLDVGQGDASVIHFPSGATVLVDGGFGNDRFSHGASTILPYLQQRGVQRLDAIIVTHYDADHVGGLPALVDSMPVARIIEQPLLAPSTEVYADWVKASSGIETRNLGQRGLLMTDASGATISLLWPQADLHVERGVYGDAEGQVENENELSLILLLTWGEADILFMGDAGFEAEAALAADNLLRPVEGLKAGHHGSESAGSRAFLEAVAPKVVVLSCGRNNPYRHPAPSALARYQETGAQVWRTDLDGSIRVLLFKDAELKVSQSASAR